MEAFVSAVWSALFSHISHTSTLGGELIRMVEIQWTLAALQGTMNGNQNKTQGAYNGTEHAYPNESVKCAAITETCKSM